MRKNLPTTRETCVQSLGGEDPLEEGMATLKYSCLEDPVDRGAWRATVHGVAKSRTLLKRLSKHGEADPGDFMEIVKHKGQR